jgi:hypothetical protein
MYTKHSALGPMGREADTPNSSSSCFPSKLTLIRGWLRQEEEMNKIYKLEDL